MQFTVHRQKYLMEYSKLDNLVKIIILKLINVCTLRNNLFKRINIKLQIFMYQ